MIAPPAELVDINSKPYLSAGANSFCKPTIRTSFKTPVALHLNDELKYT